MFEDFKDTVEYIRQAEVDLVDFKIVDLWGQWRHLTIPARRVKEEMLNDGFGFDASNYGYVKVDKSDMVLVPDPGSVFKEEVDGMHILSFLCRVHETCGDEPRFSMDPRYVCQKAEDMASSMGIGDYMMLLPEMEFYVFDKVSFDSRPELVYYSLESRSAGWTLDDKNQGYFVRKHNGYQVSPPQDVLFGYRNRLSQKLEENGIKVKYHHHEVGAPGQIELELDFCTPLKAADNTMMIKYLAKNLAVDMGKTATFMPKPIYNESGSGMHVHFKLYKDEKNIFADSEGYAGLSKVAHYFMGGILTHAKGLMAFTNPSTNSYKRLVPGFEAPVSLVYATGNRSAAIRIPEYAKSDNDKRFEYRPIDASSNPYLAFAAMIMAGLDGVKRKIDPAMAGFGPYDINLFELPESEQSKIEHLPNSLGGALEELKKDYHYLLEGDVFTEGLINNWVLGKQKEIEAIQHRPHPYEYHLYYDI